MSFDKVQDGGLVEVYTLKILSKGKGKGKGLSTCYSAAYRG